VPPNVDGEHAPTRKRFRDGVPAATMKSSRVHEEMGACQQLGDIDGVRCTIVNGLPTTEPH
jgi:hypothetical protein